jgi:hypothetical protein
MLIINKFTKANFYFIFFNEFDILVLFYFASDFFPREYLVRIFASDLKIQGLYLAMYSMGWNFPCQSKKFLIILMIFYSICVNKFVILSKFFLIHMLVLEYAFTTSTCRLSELLKLKVFVHNLLN